jgi:sigma-B regulation protein RsbU (phosphoserine phosphatase)
VPLEDQALGLLRSEVGGIFLGSIFLFIGIAACGIAAIRGSGVRLLLWQGIFSATYGARILVAVPASFHVLPRSTWPSQDYVIWIITYLIPLPALLFWLELSRDKLRPLLQITFVAALVNAGAGIPSTLFTGSPDRFMTVNNVLGIWILLLLTTVVVAPSLAKKYLIVQSWVLSIGVSVFAITALYQNLKDFLNLRDYPFLEPLGAAASILALGYVAADKVFVDERRLLSIEKELEIAREIQASILPSHVPEIESLLIHAAYHPMTAVAGDFYDFIPVDQHRIGLLVADVSGHGVPAAMIAAMIKIAVQSIVPCAHSPADVLQRLNRLLSREARDQFVTAAYLFIDTENYEARYSAAGHPPLVLLRGGTLQRIESNGVVLGVNLQPDYPVRDLRIYPGDRFLLYTDGVIEPENAKGKAFGESKFEQVVLDAQIHSPSDLVDRLLTEIRCWQPPSMNQQDDITLVAIDVH